jgi:hypothetical protein
MPERAIRIEADGVRLYAVLGSTPTADAVWEALPLEGPAQIWGEEVYFSVKLPAPLESDARAEVKVGDIGFWPDGPAIALFFGRTPASKGDDPVAASKVNVFGRITGDAGRLGRVRPGSRVRLTRLEG